jgi:hypothetical protein
MGKKSGSGIQIRDEQLGSYFKSIETIFWVKIFKFFDVDLGSVMVKFRIRDPGQTSRICNTANRAELSYLRLAEYGVLFLKSFLKSCNHGGCSAQTGPNGVT